MVLLCIMLIGGAYYVRSRMAAHRTYTIDLTEEGFSPQTITIHKGDTVVFTSRLNERFWPASNPHPIHDIYPAFDPHKPIEPGASWSFQFNAIGTWNFHDHLNPYYKGTITVTDANGQTSETDCSHASENNIQCWEKLIDSALQKKGLDAAFEILADLYAKNPAFASNCHSFTHTLGKAAYRAFSTHQNFTLSPKTSYCGYGFYHGFMEALVLATGDATQAKDFCDYVKNQLAGQTYYAQGACYHGIGHGAVDGGDPRAWGDAQAIIEPGLTLCEKVGGGFENLHRCFSGVFNSLAIMYNAGTYNLKVNKDNPYDICSKQKKEHFKKPCYEEMNTVVLPVAHNDFAKALHIIGGIEKDEYATYAVLATASYAAFSYGEKYKTVMEICDKGQQRLRNNCIAGYAAGLVEDGKPGDEYKRPIEFCRLATDKEASDACMDWTLSYLKKIYSPEKMTDVCRAVSEDYRSTCTGNM